MSQGMFERWHAGLSLDEDQHNYKRWLDNSIFSELHYESSKLEELLNDNNSWEAYCRLNSWLHALNRHVTYYNGETGGRVSDVETQGPLVKVLRWIGLNTHLISRIMAGIGAEYYSITESPSGILLTVSFRPASAREAVPVPRDRAIEVASQPTAQVRTITSQPEGKASSATGGGSVAGSRPLGFLPNDMRSNALNPNNAAYTAAQINRANQMNPNNRAYRSSRNSRRK